MADAQYMDEPFQRDRHGVLTTSRRRLLTATGAATVLALTTRLPTSADTQSGPDMPLSYPFSLGVAAGDPVPDGVVIWTRLAPEPLEPLGGMPYRDRRVRWEVATDERFRDVVRRGTATARPAYAHSVHVDVRGLQPDRLYHYRFRVDQHISPVGRARTAPAEDAALNQLAFAFVSCQHYAHGHYTAYQHMADDELDFVVHLGDYIYESGASGDIGRPHVPDRTLATLDEYRIRHALYKTDPHLQAVHARFPFIVTWDDHEVQNVYAGGIAPGDDEPSEAFLVKRANAYRAYWEHMPLRLPEPVGPDLLIYRRLRFGDLAEFSILDNRQYRSNQTCGACEDLDDPDRTYLGDEQKEWLLDGMSASGTAWNVIAQQQIVNYLPLNPDRDLDTWNGYPPARQRLLDGIVDRDVENVVVLSGDAHVNLAGDLKRDFDDPDSATIAAEFLGTSISTSGGGGAAGADGADMDSRGEEYLAFNPHLQYYSQRRGYVRCTVSPDEWRTDYRIVPYVREPGAPISTDASFVVTHGESGIEQI